MATEAERAALLREMMDKATPDDLRMNAVRDQKMEVHKTAAINRIAAELLGVRAEHGDTIYTQHPLMAGVLRKALRDAYAEGAGQVARELIESVITRRQ